MTKTNNLRVWGIGTVRTFRVHWMLAELGLAYETKPILTRTAMMDEPDFRALSERNKIPLLEDSDLALGKVQSRADILVELVGDTNRRPMDVTSLRRHIDARRSRAGSGPVRNRSGTLESRPGVEGGEEESP